VIGTNRALLGLGIGAGVAAAGITAWALGRGSGDDHAAAPHDHSTHSHDEGYVKAPVPDDYDPGRVRSPLPTESRGPGDLAVAWWPQDLSLAQHGDDATLRFQSTIANIGGEAMAIRPGDRLEYTVTRQGVDGAADEVVGHGSAPLTAADLEAFPVAEGTEIGHSIQTYGNELEPVSSLGPQTAAIIGAKHASQAIELRGAREGHYLLRQEIVRADRSVDASEHDDVRINDLVLDGHGGMLHASSRYAGGERPNVFD
jgi:hypothetical protein